jgi:hypothetical protein
LISNWTSAAVGAESPVVAHGDSAAAESPEGKHAKISNATLVRLTRLFPQLEFETLSARELYSILPAKGNEFVSRAAAS